MNNLQESENTKVMTTELKNILSDLHEITHEVDKDDDSVYICYQYKDLDLYVHLYAFDEKNLYDGNTVYISNTDDEYELSEEDYDLSKEEIAQKVKDELEKRR